MQSGAHPQLSEPQIIQNPAFGAYLLWQFGIGYQSEVPAPAPFALTFLVLPLLLHRESRSQIQSTQKSSGLALFAAKIGKDQENLLAIHERALVLRGLSLQSLGVGAETGLISIDYREATTRANTLEPHIRKPQLPERLKPFTGAATKLGFWFSKLSVDQISMTLRIDF